MLRPGRVADYPGRWTMFGYVPARSTSPRLSSSHTSPTQVVIHCKPCTCIPRNCCTAAPIQHLSFDPRLVLFNAMAPNVERFIHVYHKSSARLRVRPVTLPSYTPGVDNPSASSVISTHLPLPRSNVESIPTTSEHHSDDDLADLWDEALNQYKDITGINLRDRNSDLYKRMEHCPRAHDIIDALNDIAREFEVYRRPRSGGIAVDIRTSLRPIVRAALVILDIGGEAASSAVRCIACMVLVYYANVYTRPFLEENRFSWP